VKEEIRVYVPQRLVRYYRRQISKNPGKYRVIEKTIDASRLPLTVQRLLAIAIFYSFIASIAGIIFGFMLFRSLIPEVELVKAILDLFGYEYSQEVNYFPIIFGFLFFWILIFGIVTYNLANYLILYYPAFIANRRKSEIDIYLPHAINMMLGMTTGGIGIHEIFRSLSESKSMFGELSKEFATVVKMSDIFEEDMLTSIRYVRDTTPSEKLSAFLDDFVFMLKGGGSMSSFLENKSREYLETQEIGFNSFLDFLSLMAEVYLSAFILLPLFLLIMFVVMQVSGEIVLEGYKFVILTILPVSTILFIYLIKAAIPVPRIKTEVEKSATMEDIRADVVSGENGFKINRFRRILKKIKIYFLFPYLDRAVYALHYRIFLFHVSIFALIVFVVSSRFMSFDRVLVVSFSAFIIPTLALIELKDRVIAQIERRIPDVFRELAILNEAGLNIIEALRVLTTVEFGIISRELSLMRKDIEWGESVVRAFKKMEMRIKSDVIAKIIPISIKAIDTSPTFKDAFLTVSNFATAEVRFKNKIKSNMFTYVVIIYFSMAVFFVIVYTLINNILYGFGDVTAVPNIELIKETFLHISVAVGFFSGIIAGVISSGKVTAGLKHSYVFLLVTYILYGYLIT
jgi:flagellar protein FlaJ